MHELGVVFKIIDDLEEVALENDLKKISSVTLSLGEVSTVIPEYLDDCWKWARQRSALLEEAELKIETIPAITYCSNCEQTYETVKYAKICPHCGSDQTWLIQGNEFLIKEIEVPDE
ncbi:hydrogenase maturation nickel metallochaperone HypA [Sharpea azabuensis]|uniref:hydrogenase maturation nickel metallochaperone HypA n=1 Tax=Sharpea azabuensis TaxID=322505 RepID=UPI0013DC86FF|nr:hydrogenase maturation nickel metallochaperone HypA [Sharpea azabuensis]